jgi:hypothetical protein
LASRAGSNVAILSPPVNTRMRLGMIHSTVFITSVDMTWE